MRCESGICSRSGSRETSYRIPRRRGLRSLYKDLRNRGAKIRFYYINSVEWNNGEDRKPGLYQTGCGLNLMSKYATLCTCKLEMLKAIHKGHERLDKEPIYVAVLGDTEGRRKNSRITPLVFLGKVERSFNSFPGIWKYLPKKARHAKNVRRHFLGDLYPPGVVRKFHQTSRIRFPNGHSHANGAYKEDLRKSRPLVFKEWEAWPGANVGFSSGDEKNIASKEERMKFKRMIKAPRQSRYGWLYSLPNLRSLMRRHVL